MAEETNRTVNAMTKKRNLEQTLQALYDSEINDTITMLWDGGVDFAFLSSMEYEASRPDDWHNVPSIAGWPPPFIDLL